VRLGAWPTSAVLSLICLISQGVARVFRVILVDTSVWIHHLRLGDSDLSALLEAGLALSHAMVIGELSCGNLKNRAEFLADLKLLPLGIRARDEEVYAFIDRHRLFGRGIGWIDAHLLASALIGRCGLLTRDQRLAGLAVELKVANRAPSVNARRIRR